MLKTNIRRLIYHVRHRYVTMNNIVIAIALVIGAGWAFGSIGMMQRNYNLQKEVDDKARQLQLVKLETQSLQYQQKYYQSDEYQELAAKQYLGLANPGEKVLILPPNSAAVIRSDQEAEKKATATTAVREPSNLQQWLNFLLGADHQGLQ